MHIRVTHRKISRVIMLNSAIYDQITQNKLDHTISFSKKTYRHPINKAI
jgi:hypothetical protein